MEEFADSGLDEELWLNIASYLIAGQQWAKAAKIVNAIPLPDEEDYRGHWFMVSFARAADVNVGDVLRARFEFGECSDKLASLPWPIIEELLGFRYDRVVAEIRRVRNEALTTSMTLEADSELFPEDQWENVFIHGLDSKITFATSYAELRNWFNDYLGKLDAYDQQEAIDCFNFVPPFALLDRALHLLTTEELNHVDSCSVWELLLGDLAVEIRSDFARDGAKHYLITNCLIRVSSRPDGWDLVAGWQEAFGLSNEEMVEIARSAVSRLMTVNFDRELDYQKIAETAVSIMRRYSFPSEMIEALS